ncbi:MAG: SH3 domain-containing protein [Desulfobacula sp.]|jgi:SH3-like domain-containing protein|nr:SH3 domain-containing protein [Desulfobacula sp.]
MPIDNVKSVVVIKKKCNVRSGPGVKNRILFTVEKGIPFKVIADKGNWVRIEHADGGRGWIYKTLIKRL